MLLPDLVDLIVSQQILLLLVITEIEVICTETVREDAILFVLLLQNIVLLLAHEGYELLRSMVFLDMLEVLDDTDRFLELILNIAFCEEVCLIIDIIIVSLLVYRAFRFYLVVRAFRIDLLVIKLVLLAIHDTVN